MVELDDVAKQIIAELQKDGRTPFAAIAKKLGLSEGAIRQRYSKLKELGLIQVVAVTDPMQLGFERQAMIGIGVTGRIEPVADAVQVLPEVTYVVITAGPYDLLVEVVCESDEHMLDLISNKIRRIEGVSQTDALMYLQLRKQTYSWGVR
ncbi:Lrp/AsnC family transcriptional regulator [Millisia brevis]|uniref:Lrp/AsnC family transcriptional regulator n=1 Tax=Millisia brevis TaxID=264148 RepID=UPI0008294EB4|nr:Lrp/AsnC family transcriptional regulator [Millisia brevis]